MVKAKTMVARLTSTMLNAVSLMPSESILSPLPQQEPMSYVTLFALAATASVDPLKFPLL